MRLRWTSTALLFLAMLVGTGRSPAGETGIREYPVPPGSHPHDVAPAPDGSVWYTAQHAGALGRLDPVTGTTRHIPLGAGSSPHGVIVGPDGAPWITDSGRNAILRVDPASERVSVHPLPKGRGDVNLNTAAFDRRGILWFTGQNGVYGRLDPRTGRIDVFDAPRGRGPYGIASNPDGSVYYASLAGNHVARIDTATGAATVIEPPTPRQGARRAWSDSRGRIWVSDFGANAIVRFDPERETFRVFPLPSQGARVRQPLGRKGEVWGAESGADRLVVIRVGE